MRIAIVTPLEAELVERIRAVDRANDVFFEPRLLPPPRFPCDHRGRTDFVRSAADEDRFWSVIAESEILYGIPNDSARDLAKVVACGRRVRWVQGMRAGTGEQIRTANLSSADLARVAFTSAAGIHAGTLSEFVFAGMLALRKDLRRLERLRVERAWDHWPMDELAGSSLAVVGMGAIGQMTARIAHAFGMRVIGVTRTGAPSPHSDLAFSIERLREAFSLADAVVVSLPATDKTRGLVHRRALEALRPNAIFCNVGRGSVVDQGALVALLQTGAIAGAVLDVFEPEPLPADHPLWTLPNVVFSPHTAALSVHENARIVAIFCDNLVRFANGEPLRNRVDPLELY